MLDRNLLRKVKDACVGIVLRTNDNTFLKVVGSGFILSEEYVLTTSKVLEKSARISKAKKEELDLTTYLTPVRVFEEGSSTELEFISCSSVRASRPLNLSDAYSGRDDFGQLGLFIPGDYKSRPFLEIKKDYKLNLYDEVCICGYPSGEQSLDLEGKFSGLRLSPVTQFGRITGFMPTDGTPIPHGLQTDIIGTSGSSGSPIVDLTDGKVVGIAQQVLRSNIPHMIPTSSIEKMAVRFETGNLKTGPVYGLRIHMIHDIYKRLNEEPDKLVYEFESHFTQFRFGKP
jgi:hypothetical protein